MSHQIFVLPDPVAFRYLSEDSDVNVLEPRHELAGYQLYVVEQWACSRTHPIFVIATYTGDPTHVILVGVLRVPTNESTWSPRLRAYFTAVQDFHARRKTTPAGTILVTNLNSFPSALTVVHVPDGNLRKHRVDFRVNENLKRLGCSGRAALVLAPPADATHAKFLSLYKTSDHIEFQFAVTELVRFCQVALVVFGKLDHAYADGLLCDVTERAINDWWNEFGDIHDVEPSDGILGPTTVAAILGILMGARNRLKQLNYDVPKDCFDLKFESGISHFQKHEKLERTGKLGRRALDRLHKVSANRGLVSGLKSTVADLGGKGGEMVVEMVGGQKAITAVETTDIDKFSTNVKGESAQWLWHGKRRPNLPESPEEAALKDESLGLFPFKKRQSEYERAAGRELDLEREPQLRKTVLKSVTDRLSDARSGFGWIRDAVGLPSLRVHPRSEPKRAEKPEPLVTSARNSSDAPRTGSPRVRTPISRTSTPEPVSRTVSHGSVVERFEDNLEPRELIQPMLLRRRCSDSNFVSKMQSPNEARWPRSISFSLAENAVSPKYGLPFDGVVNTPDPEHAYFAELFHKSVKQELWAKMDDTQQRLAVWVNRSVHDMRQLDSQLSYEMQDLVDSYHEKLYEWQDLKHSSDQHITDEESFLAEAVKEVEVLSAKLEYEIGSLRSRVQDIEYGIANFASQVEALETRALTLDPVEKREGWMRWGVRFFFGIGDGPTETQ